MQMTETITNGILNRKYRLKVMKSKYLSSLILKYMDITVLLKISQQTLELLRFDQNQ
jgi:hypothetical protein